MRRHPVKNTVIHEVYYRDNLPSGFLNIHNTYNFYKILHNIIPRSIKMSPIANIIQHVLSMGILFVQLCIVYVCFFYRRDQTSPNYGPRPNMVREQVLTGP
jgi:hypothetical protein